MDILNQFEAVLKQLGNFLWGFPLMILLVGTGLWLTLASRGIQFRALFHALYLVLIKRKEEGDEPGDITHFQALMTALSATVGTGNIAGVATAIAAGGPGALFWMWITGLVGMATGAVIIGGIKSIGKVTAFLVPIMIVFYMGGAFVIMLVKLEYIPAALVIILEHAFTPTAASGGFLGATVMLTLRMGVARGVF